MLRDRAAALARRRGAQIGRIVNDRRLVAAVVVWRRDPMRLGRRCLACDHSSCIWIGLRESEMASGAEVHVCGSAAHALDPDVLNAGDAGIEILGRDDHVGGE
jgi:hypothetical protein